jgi:predicted acylesterase/phospholipase RssA
MKDLVNNTSKIDNIALIGGGAKGLAYQGSYAALDDAGIVKGINNIAGTSIGALTALLISMGVSPKDVQEQMKASSIPDLLGKGQMKYLGMQKDGKPLQEFLSKNIRNEFQKTFDSNPRLDPLSSQEKKRFSDLRANLQNPDYKPSMVDLAIMRKVNPEKYKNLIVTAVHRKSQTLHVFSSLEQTAEIRNWVDSIQTDKAELIALKTRSQNNNYKFTENDLSLIKNIDKTKDFCIVKNKKGENEIFSQISIIKAVASSAALPIVLENIDINGEKFSDGGPLKNMPFDILPSQEGMLMLAFNEKAMQKAIHGDSNDNRIFDMSPAIRLLHYILRSLGVLIEKPFEQTKNEELLSVRKEAALKTVPNDVGDISTASFAKAQKQKDEMYLRGYFSTMNHLILYNKHPKAAAIAEKELQLFSKRSAREDVKSLDAEIESLSKDFAKFRKEFEMRKFCFEVIDTKGLSRKTQKYRWLLSFCMDKSNFENRDTTEVAKEFLQQVAKGNERILASALNDPKIASDHIREAFKNALNLSLGPREDFTTQKMKGSSWAEYSKSSDQRSKFL